MRAHARSLLSILTVLFFVLFLTLAAAPLPQGSGTALADSVSGWEEQDLPYTEGEITAVSAADANTAWASINVPLVSVDDPIGVLKTENGGSDWFIQDLGEYMSGMSTPDIAAVNENTAWTIKGGAAYRTIDGGDTWNMVKWFYSHSTHGDTWAQDICAAGADTAIFLGWNYYTFTTPYYNWSIYRTSDGGLSWTYWLPYYPASPVFYEDVSSIDVADDSTFWFSMLTEPLVVARSTDGGANWEIHEQNDYYIHDLCALDSLHAWAVGSEATTTPGTGTGVILKTADGGATWEVQRSEPGLVLSSISAVDADVAWVAGEVDTTYATADMGIIMKTVDGGATWIPQHEFVGGYLSDICAVDESIAWAGGKSSSGEPLILKTENGGNPIPLSVTSITPDQAIQHTIAMNITDLSGTGFVTGATVRLEKGESMIDGYNVQVVSHKLITCQVGFFGVEPGVYDVVVTNPDGQEARLPGAFTVNSMCGQGSGTALLALGLTLGLLSLAGTAGVRRRRKKR